MTKLEAIKQRLKEDLGFNDAYLFVHHSPNVLEDMALLLEVVESALYFAKSCRISNGVYEAMNPQLEFYEKVKLSKKDTIKMMKSLAKLEEGER